MDGRHSAWVGFVGGVGLAVAGAAFPIVFPKVSAPVAMGLFWGGVAVGFVSGVALIVPTRIGARRVPERLALNAFLYMAELHGWVFKGAGQDALKLLATMAQALADGTLLAWGRKRGIGVFVQIPADEWRTLRIDLMSAFDCRPPNGEIAGVQTDNAVTSCFEAGNGFNATYRDLHLSGAAVSWLKGLR